MRRRYVITNRTHWRTADLRAFVVRAGRMTFRPDEKPVVQIEFVYNRQARYWRLDGVCSTGRAVIDGSRCKMRIPSRGPVDQVDLAGVLAHEFGHLRGLRHKDMKGPRWQRTGPAHREMYAWGAALPLRTKEAPVKKRASPDERVEHTVMLLQRWRAKKKRAETAIKKYETKLKRWGRAQSKAAQGPMKGATQ